MTASDTVSPPSPSAIPRPPRPAATIVVARDAPDGLEVLLSRRAERGDHNSGAWVFPGGVVDPGDRDAHPSCAGIDDQVASARLGMAKGGLDYYVAAIRECFEESGLLFAATPGGDLIVLDDVDHGFADGVVGNGNRNGIVVGNGSSKAGAGLGAWRGLLHRHERTLGELCAAFGVALAADRLVYLSHWLTPLGRAKRFDTRFFVAALPPGQTAAFDGTEMVEQLWLRPDEALARRDELRLMTPTQKTLEHIRGFATAEALLGWARAPRVVPLTLPRLGIGRDGMRPVLPGEPAYAEIGRLDPAGHGTAGYDIEPGVAVRLSPRLLRVTAGNGGVMTGPGTNTYLLGGGAANEWAVIDPGPADEVHLAALLAAAPGTIRWIFATHTHKDHSPLAMRLKALTGATVHGRIADHGEWQDADFRPDVVLEGEERFVLPGPDGESINLRAIRTPGHASNHVCFLLEEEKLLFTGDHVMQASTVVINPPDGDMAAYVNSLRELLDEDVEWLAPGHGFLMAEPRRAMQGIIEHRLEREAKVVAALGQLGTADEQAVLEQVYDDVSAHLHPVALRSLRAHLYKLRDEDRAVQEPTDGRWMLSSS